MHPKLMLRRHGLEPKKSLGQNFLFDENLLAKIVSAADIIAQDAVLEIGPGLGSLTRLLAASAASVTAVELDKNLIPILLSELQDCDNVNFVQGDILDQNISDLFDDPFKVVANVPYYITGAILRHLLSSHPRPSLMVLTMQKEVAERVTAVPPRMSLLAVSVQFYGQARIVDSIKAGAFWPRPEIDSAVVRVDLPEMQMSSVDVDRFFRLVKAGFSQKRKQLQKNLRQLGYDREMIADALDQAGVNGRQRAETLSIDDWRRIATTIQTKLGSK